LPGDRNLAICASSLRRRKGSPSKYVFSVAARFGSRPRRARRSRTNPNGIQSVSPGLHHSGATGP
jgi:hypothetical protein